MLQFLRSTRATLVSPTAKTPLLPETEKPAALPAAADPLQLEDDATKPSNKRVTAAAQLVAAAAFFGLAFVLLRVAEVGHALSPAAALMLRGLVQTAFSSPLLLADGDARRKAAAKLPLLAARGALGAASIGAQGLALTMIPAGAASVLLSTSPLFAALLARLALREPLRRALVPALALSLLGMLLLVSARADSATKPVTDGMRVWGSAVGLGAAVLQAAAYVALRGLRTAGVSPVSTVAMHGGAMTSLGALLGGVYGVAAAPWAAVAVMLVSAVVSVCGQYVVSHALRDAPAAAGTLVTGAEVAFVYAFAGPLLGEWPSLCGGLGATLVISGTIVAGLWT